MRVLVTGGAGFIGGWVVRTLLASAGYEQVTNLDALTYAGNPDNLADIAGDSRYAFAHGDIRDANLVNRLMGEHDACIHLAAETHVDRSITGPMVFTETNVLGTHVLLEAAKTNGLQKFVHVSTDEVYGTLALDTPDLFTESTPLAPNSPYAASKAASDLLALSYFETYGLPLCITRCGNNYGPYQYPEKLIPFFVLKALSGEKVPVYGDGKNVRDWIHVADHARAIVRVLEDGVAGNAYNIGASSQRDNMTVTRAVLALLGFGEERIQYVADRPGHDRRYALDPTKIKRDLKWEPETSFEQGLQDTVAWYQANSQWIANLQARAAREKTEPGAAWLQSAS